MIVVLALLIATLTVAGYVFRVERDDADRRERDVARQAAQTTDLLLVRGISSLLGARGLVDELGYVDPDGFDAFARAFAGAPGLDGVLLVRRVPANQRDLFRVEIGPPIRDISPSGELVPADDRPVHFAVEQVDPARSQLKRLLSVDLLGTGAGQGTRDSADDWRSGSDGSGQLAGAPRTGFLAVAPLYKRYQPIGTPEQRRRARPGSSAPGTPLMSS